jgi:hypothetical protein
MPSMTYTPGDFLTQDLIPSHTMFDGTNTAFILQRLKIAFGQQRSRTKPIHVTGPLNTNAGGYQTIALYDKTLDSMWYCPNGSATQIAIMSCKDQVLSYTTQSGGLAAGGRGYGGGCNLPNGDKVFVPIAGATPALLIVHPDGTYNQNISTGGLFFSGCAMGHTDVAVMSPFSGKAWGEYDYKTGIFTSYPNASGDSGAMECLISRPDGKMVTGPNSVTTIGTYDPTLHSYAQFAGAAPVTSFGPQGFCVTPGTEYYMTMTGTNTNQMPIYNWGSDTFRFGFQIGTANTANKFSGIVPMRDGTAVIIPRASRWWVRVDTRTQAVVNIIDTGTADGSSLYLGGGRDKYGRVWVCPTTGSSGSSFDYLDTGIPDGDDGSLAASHLLARF